MIRLILISSALFALPWGMWWAIHGRKEPFSEAPHRKLFIYGVAFLLFGLSYEMQKPKEGMDGTYVPAKVQDGTFIPGHFETKPQP
jgi:hypothetical protein